MEKPTVHEKATLKDVATRAGVSVATASYILNRNEKQRFSEATRQRVRSAAQELGYMPNISARSLRSNRSGCIGVAIEKNVTIPRYAQTLQGIRQELERNGCRLMLCTIRTIDGEYPDYISSFFARAVDGIIYIGADSKGINPRMEELILEKKIPVVAFDCEADPGIPSVEIDYYAGARELILHLADLGVRRFHYLRNCFDGKREQRREQGVLRAIYDRPELELEIHRLDIRYGVWEGGVYRNGNMQVYQSHAPAWEREQFEEFARKVRECVTGFLPELEPPPGADYSETGIVCSWAGMEQHVCAALDRCPFRPRIGVLAQGLLFSGSYPYITYSELPNFQAGQACARKVLELLDHPSKASQVVLAPTLRGG